ncbi:unnamed protein product [Urochloa humidicola]
MSFVVTKTSPPALVVPSKPTPGGNLPLTSTDKSRLFVPFTSFLVFERPIPEPAETIRRALSHALVHYYPVAGRVAVAAATGGDAHHHLACTGEGVAFASATAICTLHDIRFLHSPPSITLSELSLRYGGKCGVSDPLVMIQVTNFACGGYVVAATWNHGVADASGIGQFLQAVGELARGFPSPAVAPVRHDPSFPDIPQLMSALRRRAPPGFESQRVDYAYTDVTIPWSFINRVKAEFRRSHGGCEEPCTSFEAVTAAVWQCRTRAINNADADALAPLVFAAKVRGHVGIEDGYYGNCVSSQMVVATSGAVANGAIVDVVKMIKDAKGKIPESLRRSKGEMEMELDDGLVVALCGYNVLRVTCWSRVGLGAVDFGGGTPERVVPSVEQKRSPLCFPCLPCSRNGHAGANVVAFCVTEEHVDEFHAQLARLR